MRKWTHNKSTIYEKVIPLFWHIITQEYNRHPLKPSGYRIEELCYPWLEGELSKPLSLRKAIGYGAPFDIYFRDAGLFGKDRNFWKSVHSSGEALQKEIEDAMMREKQEWQRKVVVDDVRFQSVSKFRKKIGQLDKMEGLLKVIPTHEKLTEYLTE